MTVQLRSRHHGLSDFITNRSVPDRRRTCGRFHAVQDGILSISSSQWTKNILHWVYILSLTDVSKNVDNGWTNIRLIFGTLLCQIHMLFLFSSTYSYPLLSCIISHITSYYFTLHLEPKNFSIYLCLKLSTMVQFSSSYTSLSSIS